MSLWKFNWIHNENFIFEYEGDHAEYLDELRRHVRYFKYSKPLPIRIGWNERTKQVRFLLENGLYEDFYVNPHLSKWDFVHKVERIFLKPFFPMWEVERNVRRKLNAVERRELMQQGIPAHKTIHETVAETIIESGIIDKIWLKQDYFQLIVNGHKTIRASTVPGKALFVSDFLRQLREIEEPLAIRDYIFENSVEIVESIKLKKNVEIDYEDDEMLINFFKENIYDLVNEPFEDLGDSWWNWGRFEIYFPNKGVRKECEKIVADYKLTNKNT